MNLKGYTGNILEVDLSDGEVIIKKERVEDLKKYIGGMGMNCFLAAERLKPQMDPFSPENPIIIGTGPLVGTIMPGSSRTTGLTKFPASGAIANVCGGMSFGFQLKQAGYDHLIIHGKLEKPCYLLIVNDQIELVEANELWGKDIISTTDFMWNKYKDCGVIAIGQAGENKVKHG